VLLLVDAQEGPMPQTKFVLKKSLELGLKPIVVINKIDKPAARPDEVNDMVLELFMDLKADDKQLEFKTIYTIAKQGIAKNSLKDDSKDLNPLLDMIMENVKPASSKDLSDKKLLFQPFNLAYDNFLGRMAIGRIYEGKIKDNQSVFIKNKEETRSGKLTKLFTFHGLERRETKEAEAGDIVMIAGLPDIFIGETICEDESQETLPSIDIDEPTISLNFLVNDSPFAGREGDKVTTRQIRERLEKELEVNVGLKIDFSNNDFYKVFGRGELHITILLENMRKEGFELQVSEPQVIIKEEDGKKLEPFEEVTIDVPETMSGTVIEKLAKRKGQMIDMQQEDNNTRMIFHIPTRGLLGYRGEFIIDTKGEGILCSRIMGFKPLAGEIKKHSVGSMISTETGKSLGYSLFNVQDRGKLYIKPNTEVYEGMVIGNTSKGIDIPVNPIKGKHLTNMRASGSDDAMTIKTPKEINIERGMEIMKNDEYLEITPKSTRLRKKYLDEIERKKHKAK
ncbi:MAG: translational GTPase TypA, partial [Parcubacteria group bacterium]|nr:translational GTPase TypA [Parcubacteria group bacterium]